MNLQQFVIISTNIITPEGDLNGAVVVNNGKIKALIQRDQIPGAIPSFDCGDSVVMPGLIDTHVHINEPGRTEWEGFTTATRAAAAGGITTLIDMPLNSSPVTTTVEALQEKRRTAHGKTLVHCGFYGGIIPGNADQILPLAEAGVVGFKAFLVHSGIDDFPDVTESDLRSAMPIIQQTGLPLLVHAEYITPQTATPFTGDVRSYSAYLASRPPVWELNAVKLMIQLCREYYCPVHIVHVSASNVLEELQKARAEGLPITTETCPQYLYFAAEDIADGDTRFKCAPPIREQENREQLWQALRDGVLDMVVSDHSPCLLELKLLEEGNFRDAWGGIASLQLGLPVVWTAAKKRGFTIRDLVRCMSSAPARLAGLQKRKGALQAGYDADITVWNPDLSFEVRPEGIFHRHTLTPYSGATLNGVVERVFVQGRQVYHNGVFASECSGEFV